MTKDEALDLALEALGWTDEWRPEGLAEKAITAIKQARALDKKADNARELGLDYEPADGTQVSKVWWDGEKLMAKPIPLVDFYQPVQDELAYREAVSLATWLFKKHFAREEHYASGRVVWEPCDTTAGVISQIDNMVCGLVQPAATVQEPWKYRRWNDEAEKWELTDDCGWPSEPVYTTPPAAPVQEPVLKDNSNYRYDPPVAEPVQSCYCPNCEAMGKELAALKEHLTEAKKVELANNWFAEDWAITKAVGMLHDYDRILRSVTPPTQPAPVPLTDDQIRGLTPKPDGVAEGNVRRVEVLPGVMGTEFDEVDAWSMPLVLKIARAIEAAHGITKGQP